MLHNLITKRFNKEEDTIDLFKLVDLKLNIQASYKDQENSKQQNLILQERKGDSDINSFRVLGLKSYKNSKSNTDKSLSVIGTNDIKEYLIEAFSLIGFVNITNSQIKTKAPISNSISNPNQKLLKELIYLMSNFSKVIDLSKDLTINIEKFKDGTSIIFSIDTQANAKNALHLTEKLNKDLLTLGCFCQLHRNNEYLLISTYFPEKETSQNIFKQANN